jgi:hypothetical protein
MIAVGSGQWAVAGGQEQAAVGRREDFPFLIYQWSFSIGERAPVRNAK